MSQLKLLNKICNRYLSGVFQPVRDILQSTVFLDHPVGLVITDPPPTSPTTLSKIKIKIELCDTLHLTGDT